jgi:RpiR family transcriptional regulator, carbohydrate utilization regulator
MELSSEKDSSVSWPYQVAGIYPLRNLLSASHQMSERALKIASYILENPQSVASMSIGQLAEATGSSKAAVVRVSKLSGYEGYRGLRAALMENRGVMRAVDLAGGGLPLSRAPGPEKFTELAREVLKGNIEVLQDTFALLDEQTILEAVSAILSAKHVFLVGLGISAPLAQDAYQRFLRLQISSSICSDPDILASIAINNGPDDLLFCISCGRADHEIIEALESAKRRKAPTIILTSGPASVATELADTVLISAVRRTPQNAESVAESIAQLVVIDVICAIIASRKEPGLNGETGAEDCAERVP